MTPKNREDLTCHKHLELLISQDEILNKISSVAHRIHAEYLDKELVIVMIMKGAICLVADLIRHIDTPCSIEFIQASSYGMLGEQSGKLALYGMDKLDLSGKHVLVVDDIFDSGKTLFTVVQEIKKMHPQSLKSLVLLKKKVPHQVPYEPDFYLFEIENYFVVGYGLDFKEHFRGLRGIFILQNP